VLPVYTWSSDGSVFLDPLTSMPIMMSSLIAMMSASGWKKYVGSSPARTLCFTFMNTS